MFQATNNTRHKNTHTQTYNTKGKNTHTHLYLKRQKQSSEIRKTQQ